MGKHREQSIDWVSRAAAKGVAPGVSFHVDDLSGGGNFPTVSATLPSAHALTAPKVAEGLPPRLLNGQLRASAAGLPRKAALQSRDMFDIFHWQPGMPAGSRPEEAEDRSKIRSSSCGATGTSTKTPLVASIAVLSARSGTRSESQDPAKGSNDLTPRPNGDMSGRSLAGAYTRHVTPSRLLAGKPLPLETAGRRRSDADASPGLPRKSAGGDDSASGSGASRFIKSSALTAEVAAALASVQKPTAGRRVTFDEACKPAPPNTIFSLCRMPVSPQARKTLPPLTLGATDSPRPPVASPRTFPAAPSTPRAVEDAHPAGVSVAHAMGMR